MNYYQLELHKFIIGDLRTDGFKSDWRREQEKRRAEEMGKRIFVTAPQIKERQKRRAPFSLAGQACRMKRASRKCEVCETEIRHNNKTGRCCRHKRPGIKPAAQKYKCGACDKPMRKTVFGVCKPCFTRYRRRIEQHHDRCAECGCIIRKNTKFGLCVKHSKPLHAKAWKTTRKMRRIELRRAA